MEKCKLHRIPLNVITWKSPVAADMVGVDGCLIPIDVKNGVLQRSGAGSGHGLTGTPGSHPTLTFDDVNPRRIAAVVVHGAEGKSQ